MQFLNRQFLNQDFLNQQIRSKLQPIRSKLQPIRSKLRACNLLQICWFRKNWFRNRWFRKHLVQNSVVQKTISVRKYCSRQKRWIRRDADKWVDESRKRTRDNVTTMHAYIRMSRFWSCFPCARGLVEGTAVSGRGPQLLMGRRSSRFPSSTCSLAASPAAWPHFVDVQPGSFFSRLAALCRRDAPHLTLLSRSLSPLAHHSRRHHQTPCRSRSSGTPTGGWGPSSSRWPRTF